MILRSLELQNIRSYVSESIEFPEGSVLLAGDVGAGKSTLLLATEFALFGIQRGQLDGGDLLRHGASKGHVEVGLEIAGRKVRIRRGLAREKRGVSQDDCWIEVDGILQRKTPQEIRAAVLQLLGYPLEYLTKNPLIFRYTVYTPQDEMKRILFAPAEERLGIIRKILGVDRYGRIAANAAIIIRELRAKRRELEAFSQDLDAKADEASRKEKELEDLGRQLGEWQESLVKAEKEYSAASMAAEKVSEEIRRLSKVSRELAGRRAMVQEKERRRQKVDEELRDVEKKLASLDSELARPPQKPGEMSETEVEKERQRAELERKELAKKHAELESEVRRLKGILDKGRCDICEQEVGDRSAYASRISERQAEASKIAADIEALVRRIEESQRLLKLWNSYAFELRFYSSKLRDKEEAADTRTKLQMEREENEKTILSLIADIAVLQKEAERLPGLEAEERNAKLALDAVARKKTDVEKRLSWVDSAVQSGTRELNRLRDDVTKKKEARQKAARVADFSNWLEQSFMPLMQAMEKAILASVQREFNGYFQTWFATLMGTENLSVSIDEQFAPSIEQEGYQTEYANLSGGEKTAVALAYRLALNKVINNMIETIKTKDLLILDEPTDGFSADQVDRIRNLLAELGLRQTIIVSHEQKIDTFVDRVIRFYKEGHVSRVAS